MAIQKMTNNSKTKRLKIILKETHCRHKEGNLSKSMVIMGITIFKPYKNTFTDVKG